MRVTVNGVDREVEPGTTVGGLVSLYQLSPLQIAVEVNCDLVPRRNHDARILNEGDRVEIVTLVGGG